MADYKKKRPYLPRDGSELPHNILIPLRNFSFCHHTHSDPKDKNNPKPTSNFIGRDTLIEQLTKLLLNTSNNRGSYLIAGYRGSGKTSLINHVLNLYKENNPESKTGKVILPIRINLGHDAVLDTRHVLFNIISVIKNEFEKEIYQHKRNPFVIFISVIFFCLITYGLFKITEHLISSFGFIFQHKDMLTLAEWKDFCKWSVPILFSLPLLSSRFRDLIFGLVAYDFYSQKRVKAILSLKRQIHDLYKRVAFSVERNLGVSSSSMPFQPMQFSNKTIMPQMMEPQIELALLDILEKCSDAHIDIIFIFDELDKISLSVTEPTPTQNRECTNAIFANETVDESVVRRKKRVDSLLGSLKTLITVGQARFFFIAGRDMLDSYQAEKGSTSSLYESLFNQVFEVPSFLTDKPEQDKMRLHSMIELYVCSRLIEEKEAKSEWLANILCGEILDKFDEQAQGLMHTKNSLKEQELSSLIDCFLNKIQELSGILNRPGSSIFSVKVNTSQTKLKSDFLHLFNDDSGNFDTTMLKQNQIYNFAKFVRKIIKTVFLDEEISKLINEPYNKKQVDLKNSGNDFPYFSLNTYFLYLLDQKSELSVKDAEIIALTLRQFIYYLTIHSWGNCKRLATLFESFVKPLKEEPSKLDNDMDWLPSGTGNSKAKYMLSFGITERQRIAMGSNLYIKFGHHLSHQFTGADKLVVSTMAAFHYCLKFHRAAFSRHHLSRMTELMSAFSAPELNNILDTTITQVLWPYLRIIRGGMYRYRFFTWIEQEIRYIARTNDLESASYTFSLDSINEIKAHYRKSLESVTSSYNATKDISGERAPSLVAEINIVLGDIHFLERAYDESVIYYQSAVNSHYDLHANEKKYHLESLLRYVEALLKLGNLQEYRQRYDRALMNYLKADELINEFLTNPIDKKRLAELVYKGDSRIGLFFQPFWAIKYLLLKRGNEQGIENLEQPRRLFPKNDDPQFLFRKAQLCFYLHRHEEAQKDFLKVIQLYQPTDENDKSYYESYLLPTACINLAENFFVDEMRKIQLQFQGINNWNDLKLKLAENCIVLLETMNSVEDFKCFKCKFEPCAKPVDVKGALSLIFYAAENYEKHKLYDHAAMAHLKAISLWILMFDMLPLYHFDEDDTAISSKKTKLQQCVSKMDNWFSLVCDKALEMIMASNGYSHQQAREKWHIRDVAQAGIAPDLNVMGYIRTDYLDHEAKREILNNDIAFWQSSYLGQQLVFMRNWAFLAKRVLNFEPSQSEAPSLLKPYRIPVHTTRAYIFSSWANTRELLRLTRFIRTELKAADTKTKKDEIVKKYKSHIVHETYHDAAFEHSAEDCYDIIVAKGIFNAYTALHNIRILTENNQAIVFPPSAFVMSNLWRLLYRLIEFEMDIKQSGFNYEKTRVNVRARLTKYVSQDIPASHLDLDYVAAEAKRQLRALSTMGDVKAISRINILQNNYFLHDDYEDPGFHLDWTLTQMLIPCALMTIKWIDEDMERLKK